MPKEQGVRAFLPRGRFNPYLLDLEGPQYNKPPIKVRRVDGVDVDTERKERHAAGQRKSVNKRRSRIVELREKAELEFFEKNELESLIATEYKIVKGSLGFKKLVMIAELEKEKAQLEERHKAGQMMANDLERLINTKVVARKPAKRGCDTYEAQELSPVNDWDGWGHGAGPVDLGNGQLNESGLPQQSGGGSWGQGGVSDVNELPIFSSPHHLQPQMSWSCELQEEFLAGSEFLSAFPL